MLHDSKPLGKHLIPAATISRRNQWRGANEIRFIEAGLHGAPQSDNGTSVPPWIRGDVPTSSLSGAPGGIACRKEFKIIFLAACAALSR